MSNELAHKPTPAELDGFAGYADASEGEDEQVSSGLIVGTKIKFDEAQVWVNNVGEKLPPGLVLVLVRVLRIVQKWGADNKPIDEHTRTLEPHKKWPDLDAFNKKCPKSEWREKFGKMQGPWQGQRLVYLVDPQTMARYTWPSPKDTIGSRICVGDIVERVNWMRGFKGAHVYPVVELSDTFMPTGYGGRQRPHFLVKGWKDFGLGGEAQKLETPVQQALDDFSAKQTDTKTAAALSGKEVTPPTAKEVVDDEIKF